MIILCDLPKLDISYEAGFERYVLLLKALERLPLFAPSWTSLNVELWREQDEFRRAYADWNDVDDPGKIHFFLGALNSSLDEVSAAHTDVKFRWGVSDVLRSQLSIQILNPHPVYGAKLSLYRETIAALIAWQRPQHVSMAWPVYWMEHHPLNAQRVGIGWLGWVPFALTAEQVPEAAILEPMADGTFLASQREFWFAGGPNRDPDAIARAQALDLRLNSLGVLPTAVELQRGDWGRRG